MDYKEKYEALLANIKAYHARFGDTYNLKKELEECVPELSESEDERTRKNILALVKKHAVNHERVQMEDWLEKQKEQKPKMTPKWLYRLEFKDSSCGLWYDGSGKWCFESGIGSIGGCKTKTLPMDYDARYKQDGRDWFSSCSRKEDLMHWYSLEDAKELISKGFVFTRYLATEYHEYDQQTVFIKETALCREQIDIFELFGQKSAEWGEEDKHRLKDSIYFLESAMNHYADTSEIEKTIDWLNSLHPQPHWKPTEEQIKALDKAIPVCMGVVGRDEITPLESLYDDLKKL